MNGIEFRDLRRQYQALKEKIDGAVLGVMASSQFIGGSEVNELEDRLAEYVGTKHCISCANGTDALQLLLFAYGIGPGDAVFIPDFTFFATGEIIPAVGATPVFVDVDPRTFNIDPSSLESAINEILQEGIYRPAAVIPVDLFGLPADYPRILKISKHYGLIVIEDAAQGFGGAIGDKRACSFGDAATTSFFPAKPLGCYGDGGAIFTNDDEITNLIESLKVHGKGSHKYDNVRVGMNSRLDAIQAAILSVKLDALVEYELDAMAKVHSQYSKEIAEAVETPFIPRGFQTCNAQYTIKLPDIVRRDGLQEYLRRNGIPSIIYYPVPMHKQLAFKGLGETPLDLKTSEVLCDTVLSLPMHPYLTTNEIEKIIQAVREWCCR